MSRKSSGGTCSTTAGDPRGTDRHGAGAQPVHRDCWAMRCWRRSPQGTEVRTTVENLALLLDQSVSSSVPDRSDAARVQLRLERELRKRAGCSATISTRRSSCIGTGCRRRQVRVSDSAGTVCSATGSPPRRARAMPTVRSFSSSCAERRRDPGEQAAARASPTPGSSCSRAATTRPRATSPASSPSVPADHFQRLLSGLQLGPHGIALVRDLDMTLVARWPRLDARPG